jgi:predicted DNA-binding transcriptional regulator AlpA
MMMPRMKFNKESNEDAEYITIEGLSKMLMVTRQSIVKLINDEERNFPKPFPLLKSEKREKNIWSKAEVKAWLEEQRSQKVT